MFVCRNTIPRYVFHHALLHWSNIGTRGSEHYLEGVQQPAEIQLFHWNTKYSSYEEALGTNDGIAALSFFYQVSPTSNSNITSFITATQKLDSMIATIVLKSEKVADLTLDQLLPIGGVGLMENYYYYTGSLTQPNNTNLETTGDCTEQVLWIVYEKTVPISESQMGVLRSLLSTVNSAITAFFLGLGSADPGLTPCVSNFRPLVALNPSISATAITRKLRIKISIFCMPCLGQALVGQLFLPWVIYPQ